jgi:hypothetical protein
MRLVTRRRILWLGRSVRLGQHITIALLLEAQRCRSQILQAFAAKDFESKLTTPVT